MYTTFMSNASARNVRIMSISVRFTEQDAVRIDSHVDRMHKKNPHLQLTRTDAIRDLLGRALADAERDR